MYSIGDTVYMTEEQSLDNYGTEWLGKPLTVVAVSTSHEDHPGFDACSGEVLYDFDGVGFSLYDWEVQDEPTDEYIDCSEVQALFTVSDNIEALLWNGAVVTITPSQFEWIENGDDYHEFFSFVCDEENIQFRANWITIHVLGDRAIIESLARDGGRSVSREVPTSDAEVFDSEESSLQSILKDVATVLA